MPRARPRSPPRCSASTASPAPRTFDRPHPPAAPRGPAGRSRPRMTPDAISTDLKTVLRRLRLSRVLDTLPERLTLMRQQPLAPQDFLLLILTDEVTRRDSLAATLRAQRAGLDPGAQLEHWDTTAHVTFDRALLTELVTLRFLEAHHHVALVGPVRVR